MAITTFTRSSAAIITSIALPRHETYVGLTQIPIANLANLFLYLQPNQWISQTNSYEDPTIPPIESYFELATTGATAFATQYTMPFVASNFVANEKNTRMFITFLNAGGFIAFTLDYYFLNTEDLMLTLNANQVQNKYRLLKDELNNPLVIDNIGTGDVYSQNKDNRLSLWIADNTAVTLDFKRASIIENNNFYEVNDITRFSDISFTWTSCKANSIDCITATDITFNATDNITIIPTRTNWFIIDTVNASSTSTYQDNYDIHLRNDTATYDTNYEIPNTGASSAFTATSAYATPASTATLDGNVLICGHTYRFLVVIETATETYSFASDEWTLEHCLCLCPPLVTANTISDYLEAFTSIIYATPQERLLSTLELDITTYNACRPTAFCDALQTVTMTIYENIAPNIKHILDVKTINRNALNVLTSLSSIIFNCTSSVFKVDYEFRVRYEANIPNIISSINNINVVSLSNQDWTGRTISLDWVFTLDDGLYQDTLTYKQGFIVDLYNEDTVNDMNFTIEDNDTALAIDPDFICVNTVSHLKICSTTTDVDGAYFISGIDKESFNINNFIEEDAFPSLFLPQLLNAAVISQDTQYAANKACTILDVSLLPTETNLRFIAIKKRTITPGPCCGDPESANLLDPDYLDLIARMIAAGATNPILARRKIIANTIQQLKLAGLWTKFDCIWFIGAHDRIAGRINWKGFASTAHDLTEVNWGANYFVVDQGFEVAVPLIGFPMEYYDTNFILNTHGVTFQQNSASIWHIGEVAGNHIGIIDGPNGTQTFLVKDSTTYAVVNSIYPYTPTFPPPQTGSPFEGASRCNAVEYTQYSTAGVAAISVGGVNQPFASAPRAQYTSHIRSLSTNGIPGIGGNPGALHSNSFAAFGGCLTLNETKAFYQIIRCYFLAINSPYFDSKLPVQ